jgi:two-component system NtrC family sensor kinase
LDTGRFERTRRMILVRVLLPPFLTLLLVCGTLVYYFASYSRNQVQLRLMAATRDHRRAIDQFLGERTADLELACATHGIEQLRHRDRLAQLLDRLRAGSDAFFDLGVFDDEGNHLAYVGPFDLAGINYAGTEWFQAVRERGRYVSDVFSGNRKIPHFIIAVKGDEGGRTWYLRATIDTLFFDELVESVRIGKTGEAYLVNREGVLQTDRPSGGELMERDPDYSQYVVDRAAITSFSARGGPNRRYLYAAGPLEHANWVLVVRQERGDAYAPLSQAVLAAIAVIVIGGAGVVAMAFVLATGQVRQLMLADLEQRRMKTQLIMAGQLAEVGEMSTGVAHEINNPLQVMSSEQTLISDLLADLRDADSGVPSETLEMMENSARQIGVQIERCRRITEGLLKFARRTKRSIRPVVMQEFVPELIAAIERRARVANIRVVQEIDPGLPAVVTDPDQLQQVLLNLLNNAIDALEGKERGEVAIRVFREGKSTLVLSVSDDGCGIPAENLERVFLPFFTTKAEGHGTGLGLSTVHGIVEGLGGQIRVSSEVEAGTVFTVHLPLEPAEDREVLAASA